MDLLLFGHSLYLIDIQNKLFPSGLPTKFEWAGLEEIVNEDYWFNQKFKSHVLSKRRGLDVENANLSSEEGCIEIDTGGLIDIIKPRRLFHSFQNAE